MIDLGSGVVDHRPCSSFQIICRRWKFPRAQDDTQQFILHIQDITGSNISKLAGGYFVHNHDLEFDNLKRSTVTQWDLNIN